MLLFHQKYQQLRPLMVKKLAFWWCWWSFKENEGRRGEKRGEK